MSKKFNYTEAMKRLDEIACKVEDPSTGVGDMDEYIKEAETLVKACREYLRSAREQLLEYEADL